MERYDVVVVGLGGMGSAAVAHLAVRGAKVAGIDRFPLNHTMGASAGRSRIIRKAYFEDLAYVPLLARAYELWYELEARTAEPLLNLCGVLIVGNASANAASGVMRASREFDIPVEILDARDLRRRYPQLHIHDDEVGVFEPEAGAVFPERAIAAHLALAKAHGATLIGERFVTTWRAMPSGLVVEVEHEEPIEAARIVVCAGPWIPSAFARLGLPIHVQRNVQYWFEPTSNAFAPEAFPAFLVERPEFPQALYGFPDFGEGFKVALHGYGATTNADELDRSVSDGEIDRIRAVLDRWAPNAAGALRSVKACMYALTPDEHFAIGRDPADERIIFAGGFSGHGFKFAPAIGEVLAQLALDGGTNIDIDFLNPLRFARLQ